MEQDKHDKPNTRNPDDFDDGSGSTRDGQPESIADKTKRGMTYAFIPKRLEIEGRPELGCFPLNVLFGSPTVKDGQPVQAYALYEPVLASFRVENDESVLLYWNKYGGGGDCIRITYNGGRQSWRGEKFVGSKSAGMAFGSKWESFFAHFSGLGLTNGEHCEFVGLKQPTRFPAHRNPHHH